MEVLVSGAAHPRRVQSPAPDELCRALAGTV
jgi:hypothetical protein